MVGQLNIKFNYWLLVYIYLFISSYLKRVAHLANMLISHRPSEIDWILKTHKKYSDIN